MLYREALWEAERLFHSWIGLFPLTWVSNSSRLFASETDSTHKLMGVWPVLISRRRSLNKDKNVVSVERCASKILPQTQNPANPCADKRSCITVIFWISLPTPSPAFLSNDLDQFLGTTLSGMESMVGSKGRRKNPLLVCSPSHYLWRIVPYCLFSSDLSVLLLKVAGPGFLLCPLRDWSNVSSCQEFWSVFFLLKTFFFFPSFLFLCYPLVNAVYYL